jgi:hypothetical protein
MMDTADEPESEGRIIEEAGRAAAQLAETGHTFTHRWLEEQLALGDKPHDTASYEKWQFLRMRRIDLWREEMLYAYHVHLENDRSIGYVVIAPHETARVVRRRMQREIKKALTDATAKLIHGDVEGLNPNQMRERRDLVSHAGLIRTALETARSRAPRLPGSPMRDWEMKLIEEAEPKKRAE